MKEVDRQIKKFDSYIFSGPTNNKKCKKEDILRVEKLIYGAIS